MAKLSAHGERLYQWESLTKKYAVMADRHILRNCGSGWKLWRKIKADVDLNGWIAKRKEKLAEIDQATPMGATFQRELHKEVAFADRYRVVTGLEMLSHDPDGLWSELDDYAHQYDFETVASLCRLYNAAQEEAKKGVGQ